VKTNTQKEQAVIDRLSTSIHESIGGCTDHYDDQQKLDKIRSLWLSVTITTGALLAMEIGEHTGNSYEENIKIILGDLNTNLSKTKEELFDTYPPTKETKK